MPDVKQDGTIASIKPLPCFAHGQLVVALTRVGDPDNVFIYLDDDAFHTKTTPLVIYPEALIRSSVQRTAASAPVPIAGPSTLPSHTAAEPASRPQFMDGFDDIVDVWALQEEAWLRGTIASTSHVQSGSRGEQLQSPVPDTYTSVTGNWEEEEEEDAWDAYEEWEQWHANARDQELEQSLWYGLPGELTEEAFAELTETDQLAALGLLGQDNGVAQDGDPEEEMEGWLV